MGMILCILSIDVAFLMATPAAAFDITVTGSWTEYIDQNDLRSGIGTNLNGTYTSATNVNLVTITGAVDNSDAWQITIRRMDNAWNDLMQVSARRTSGGTGGGSVTGGQTYIQVTTSDQQFFTGTGNRSGVRIQLRVTGVSLLIPPSQYSTTIQYTVVDVP